MLPLLLIELDEYSKSFSTRANTLFERYDYDVYVDELNQLEDTVNSIGDYSTDVVSLLGKHLLIILEAVGITTTDSSDEFNLALLETITNINDDENTEFEINEELEVVDNFCNLVTTYSTLTLHDTLTHIEDVTELTLIRLANNLDTVETNVDIIRKIDVVKQLELNTDITIETINSDTNLQAYLSIYSANIYNGETPVSIVDDFTLLLAVSNDVYIEEIDFHMRELVDLVPNHLLDEVSKLATIRVHDVEVIINKTREVQNDETRII